MLSLGQIANAHYLLCTTCTTITIFCVLHVQYIHIITECIYSGLDTMLVHEHTPSGEAGDSSVEGISYGIVMSICDDPLQSTCMYYCTMCSNGGTQGTLTSPLVG